MADQPGQGIGEPGAHLRKHMTRHNNQSQGTYSGTHYGKFRHTYSLKLDVFVL